MEKSKRITALLLAGLMLLGTIASIGKVFADSNRELTQITVNMKSTELEESIINFSDNTEEKKSTLEIDWDASAYGGDIKGGDYFNVRLPQDFKTTENKIEVRTHEGTPVGQGQIKTTDIGGNLKVVFTSLVEGMDNVKGKIQIQGSKLQKKEEVLFSVQTVEDNEETDEEAEEKEEATDESAEEVEESNEEESADENIGDQNPEAAKELYGEESKLEQNTLMLNKSETVLSGIRLEPIDGKVEYLTHEKVTFYAGFSISNTSGQLDNTKLVITFPAEYIKVNTPNDHTDDDGIQPSKLDTANSGPELKLVDGNWVITYTYNSVPGGYEGDVPISIRTVMGDRQMAICYPLL